MSYLPLSLTLLMGFGTPGGMEGCHHSRDQFPVNSELVWNLLLHLDSYMLLGANGIHPRVFGEVADVIVRSLSTILQWSWESGEVPIDLKLAKVPIFKKVEREYSGNYKSVSLTSVSGEIMEKIMLEVIEKHLKDNAITTNTVS